MKIAMRRNILFILIAAAGLLTSCTTMRQSSATSMTVESGIYQYPTVADLEVKAKVEKQVQWNYVPFNWGEIPLQQRQANLIADIVKENNADILLEPQVTYVKHPFSWRTLTITGYPAVFKNFRKATEQDLRALEVVVPAPEMKVYNLSQPWYKRLFRRNK